MSFIFSVLIDMISRPFYFIMSNPLIVFRREPLWKVSMNIRVQPTVRCSFVAEENVIRIVLKEIVGGVGNARSSVEESSDSSAGTGDAVQNGNQEVVVYVLKVRLNVFNHLYLSAAGKLILSLFR